MLRPLLNSADMAAVRNTDYFLEYLTNGLIGMLLYWQQKDRRMSIEDFLKICREIIVPQQFWPAPHQKP